MLGSCSVLYRAVSTTAVTTAVPLEPPWQSGAHRPDGAWIGHIVHPYTSPQLRNAIHAFRSLTKAKEAPTERRAHHWVWCARLATIQQCIQLLAGYSTLHLPIPAALYLYRYS